MVAPRLEDVRAETTLLTDLCGLDHPDGGHVVLGDGLLHELTTAEVLNFRRRGVARYGRVGEALS